jgi:predicted glycoside hydrolase/deacetylase ChbG (UPF0249 family)
VISAFHDGVVRGASLMVAGAAIVEAAELARDHPALDVGLHLVVCRGISVLSPHRLGGIADAAWRFAESPTFAGMNIFLTGACEVVCTMRSGRKSNSI